MKRVVKLNRRYDVDKLRADFKAAREVSRRLDGEHENRGDYHDGGWSAIALWAPGGRIDAAGLRWGGKDCVYRATPILDACPYFRAVIDGFLCPKQRVRLLRLAPGAMIHWHRDDGDGWAVGKVRLHVPIYTSPQVYFYVGPKRVIMEPGQLWYCDFTTPHRVVNGGTGDRIHLVLDLVVNDWLRAVFPPESRVEKLETALTRTRLRARAHAYQLAHRLHLGSVRRTLRTFALTPSTPPPDPRPAPRPAAPPKAHPAPAPNPQKTPVRV